MIDPLLAFSSFLIIVVRDSNVKISCCCFTSRKFTCNKSPVLGGVSKPTYSCRAPWLRCHGAMDMPWTERVDLVSLVQGFSTYRAPWHRSHGYVHAHGTVDHAPGQGHHPRCHSATVPYEQKYVGSETTVLGDY